jgi:hypothetical protein
MSKIAVEDLTVEARIISDQPAYYVFIVTSMKS